MRSEEPPRISVLIPARDAADTLEACLRSVFRQSESRWECVVVNDGSTDRTAAVLRGAASHDPRVRVFDTDPAGIVPALVQGLRRCRGAYVARMDADDVMHRRRLELQLRALEDDPGLSVVGSHVRLFPRSGLGAGMRAYESWLNDIRTEEEVRREAFVECPVAHPTLMLCRRTLLRYGYRDRRWPEDYDLILRLLSDDVRVSVIPRRLLLWRESDSTHSRVDPAYVQARFVECKAAFLADGLLSGRGHYVLWGYGSTGRELARALAVHGKHPSHIVEIHPGRIGNRIRGVEVVPPEALPSLKPAVVVASVAGAGPRRRIRDALTAMGFRELVDFVCAA